MFPQLLVYLVYHELNSAILIDLSLTTEYTVVIEFRAAVMLYRIWFSN